MEKFLWKKNGDEFTLIDYDDNAQNTKLNLKLNIIGKKYSELFGADVQLMNDLKYCIEHQTSIQKLYNFETHQEGNNLYTQKMKAAYIPEDIVFLMIENLNDTKEIDANFRQIQKEFQLLYDNNPTMYFLIDQNGTILMANISGARNHGYLTSDLSKNSLFKITYEKDINKLKMHLSHSILYQNIHNSWEIRNIKKNGSIIWIKYHIISIRSFNNQMIILIAGEDISDIQQSNKELIYIKKAMESSNDGILIQDSFGKFIYQNQAFAKLFGLSTSELNNMQGLTDIYQNPHLVQEIIDATYKNSVWKGEIKVKSQEEEIKTLALKSESIKDEYGNIVGLLHVYSDISELLRTRYEKDALIKVLAEKEKLITIGQFTAVITHEINNPLDIMLTKLYLLQKQCETQFNIEIISNYIHQIKKQIFRLCHLSQDILNYVQPNLIYLESANINELIDRAIDSLYTYNTDGITIEKDFSDSLPLIQADIIGLELVFKNIILNSIQAIESSGKIKIITSNQQNTVEVIIADTGKGIPEESLSKIFNSFYTNKRNLGGTGLGLTICKAIIEQHNGTICITSKIYEGTQVKIKFTLSELKK